jgi:hypothetical protein
MAHQVTAADVTQVTVWTAHALAGDDPFGKLVKKGHAPMVDIARSARRSRIAPTGAPQTISRARAVTSKEQSPMP